MTRKPTLTDSTRKSGASDDGCHLHGELGAEYRCRESITRNEEREIRPRRQIGIQVHVQVRRKPTDLHFARCCDVRARSGMIRE